MKLDRVQERIKSRPSGGLIIIPDQSLKYYFKNKSHSKSV